MSKNYTTEILREDRWDEWDAFVDKTPQGTVFHRTDWLLALTDKSQVSLLVCRNAAGEIAGGLPLISRPIRWYSTIVCLH